MLSPTPEDPPKPPSTRRVRLGRYELTHELGHGGMASVHLARVVGPASFTKWLAVKRIHPRLAKETEFLHMFLDEARIAASLQHPNVATVFELAEHEGEYLLAMEYLHGEHLGAVGRRAIRTWGSLPPELAARIVANAADGLHHAHEAKGSDGEPLGLVHRDVSPQNIFVTYDGQVKITDFGIAKAAGRLTQTATGHMKGKVAYMAPEHALSQPLDRRSDIFALGVVLWEISVGQRLFKAESDVQTLMRITSGRVPRPSEKKHDYPEGLEPIVMRALALSPEDRYPTAAAMARELDRFVASTGRPAGSSEIADRMRALFPDRIEVKGRMLRGDGVVESERPTAPEDTSHVRDRATTEVEPAPKRRGMVIASLAAAALVGVGGAAMFASGSNASVRIATQPVGAQAFLDGDRALGATPIELANLEPGEHTIRLVEEGYEPLEARFEARTDAPTDLRFTLEREERSDTMPVVVPPAPVAEVEASAENATADSAARDGTATDNTDLENRAESGDAENTVADGADPQARGTRMIRPRRGGGARRAAQRPNDSTEMAEAEMAPSAMTSPPETPAAADGELTIMSLPWSSVSVDGQRPRSTPLRRLRLSAGRHAIRYRVQGEGDERSTSVVIEPGGTQTLRLDTR